MILSIIIPVFNELQTIREIISKVKSSPLQKEIIIVDDFSQDGTREFLANLKDNDLRILFHKENKGKGAAVRTGIAAATGEIIIIQDADLEYDPGEYALLIEPIVSGRADAVYGSRFHGQHDAFLFSHYIGNKFLTSVTNLLYRAKLTDMETCYKVVKADILKSFALRSDRFEIEPEITAKLLKKGYRVREVPIHYSGRSFKAGKKITWRDGFKAVAALIRYRFRD